MPTIAIRQSAAAAMPARHRKLARWVLEQVGLIEPAKYTAPGGAVWLIFDDHRIDLRDVAYFGKFADIMASIPAGYDPPDAWGDATAAEARAFIRNYLADRVVWPVAVADGDDPWQTVLDAQDAPASVKAGSEVPATWAPSDA